MKDTIKSSFFLAIIAIAFLLTAYPSQGAETVHLYLKRVDNGQSWDVKSTTISSNGSFIFKNVPAGNYELVLSGSEQYFTSKAADNLNIIEINDFNWGSSMNKTLISTSKSNIRHNGIAGGAAGSEPDSTQAINTTRSNIKHQNCTIAPNGTLSTTDNGKTIYYQVLVKDIVITATTSPSGTITNIAIKENGVK